MCDPITLAGIGLTAASTVAGMAGQSQAQSAEDQVLDAQRAKQAQYDRNAAAVNKKSQADYTGFTGQQDTRANDLSKYFTTTQADASAAGPVGAPADIPVSSSNIVNAEDAKQEGKTAAFSGQQSDALGQLRSFGDILGDKSRDTARDAGKIAQIGDFKTGWSNLAPFALDNASHAGDTTDFVGTLLGGLGKVGLSAGLSGGSLSHMFGSAAPTVTPAVGGVAAAMPSYGSGALAQPFAPTQRMINPFLKY